MADTFSAGSLACGCIVGFAPGRDGSPVTVVVARKADGCTIGLHVAGLAVYDHREAHRPSTRHQLPLLSDFEGDS
jgi:hypothetical protein